MGCKKEMDELEYNDSKGRMKIVPCERDGGNAKNCLHDSRQSAEWRDQMDAGRLR